MFLGALVAAGNAFVFTAITDFSADYGGTSDVGFMGQKARMFAVPVIGYAHTLGGMFASLIGPFQFVGFIRQRYRRLHVWLGRIYLVCVMLSAIAGLYLSPDSEARNTLGVAFIALALAWIYTGTQAYVTIRRRDFRAHRRWMIRNFALTYAAVTLRFQMPALIVAGVAPITALNIVGWTCWVPSLIIVEAWMRGRREKYWGAASYPA